ncbi:MAG: rod shape-determining protein [Nitrobacter sp.]
MFGARGARRAIGIDLGTANTVAVTARGGIVFDQPSVCCFQGYDAMPQFVSAGHVANSYVGKITRPLKIVRPLKNGVLSDMTAARELLHFVHKAIGGKRYFGRLRPHIGIPADATQSERSALFSAATDAGFGKPELVPEPLLAAIGLGLDVEEARGRMIVDCGAGTTEAAVISLGGICLTNSVRGGGEELNRSLIEHLHSEHRFQIGIAAAEAMKLRLSVLLAGTTIDDVVEVRGLDAASGLPRALTVPASELLPVWQKYVSQIVTMVRETLRDTPAELSKDILEDGITLTGGGSLSAFLANQITSETTVTTRVADAPRHCVAFGLQRLLENQE